MTPGDSDITKNLDTRREPHRDSGRSEVPASSLLRQHSGGATILQFWLELGWLIAAVVLAVRYYSDHSAFLSLEFVAPARKDSVPVYAFRILPILARLFLRRQLLYQHLFSLLLQSLQEIFCRKGYCCQNTYLRTALIILCVLSMIYFITKHVRQFVIKNGK